MPTLPARWGRLLALLIGLLGARAAQAQLFYDVELQSDQRPKLTPPVYVTQVVDARANKTGLGWVSNGLENQRRLMRFPRGLEQELTSFVTVSRPPAGALPLVLVVRRLTLAEQFAGLHEVGLTEVVADFYYQHSDGYHLMYHATELASASGFDVTSRHSQLLARVLQQALAHVQGLGPDQATAGPALSWAGVMEAPAPPTYPILTATELRPGLYRTPADFQQNKPVSWIIWTSASVRHLPGYSARRLQLHPTAGSEPLDEATLWGFCDGVQLFVRNGEYFFPVQRTPAGFFYKAPVYLDSRQKKTAALYVPGGVIMKSSPPLTEATLQLWPDTGFAGEAMPVTTRADAPGAAATVVVYRQPDADPNRAVTIRLNGQTVGSLRGGEYLSMPIPAGELSEINVCGQTERESCFRFRPDQLATNYLICRLGTATQPAPTLRLVSGEVGVAAVQECVAAAEPK